MNNNISIPLRLSFYQPKIISSREKRPMKWTGYKNCILYNKSDDVERTTCLYKLCNRRSSMVKALRFKVLPYIPSFHCYYMYMCFLPEIKNEFIWEMCRYFYTIYTSMERLVTALKSNNIQSITRILVVLY